MKMKAPEGATCTGMTGTDGKHYVITPDDKGVAEVHAAAALAASQHGWVPLRADAIAALRAEPNPMTDRDRKSGIVAAGTRMAEKIKEAISPTTPAPICMLCDEPIEKGAAVTDVIEREGELYKTKKDEKGAPAHSDCWNKLNDPKGD